MNDSTIDERGLKVLLLSALDGDASDAEIEWLNDVLRRNEELRRSAARFLCDDAFLAEEIGTIEQAVAFLKLPMECGSSNGEAPRAKSDIAASLADTSDEDHRPIPAIVLGFARRRVAFDAGVRQWPWDCRRRGGNRGGAEFRLALHDNAGEVQPALCAGNHPEAAGRRSLQERPHGHPRVPRQWRESLASSSASGPRGKRHSSSATSSRPASSCDSRKVSCN